MGDYNGTVVLTVVSAAIVVVGVTYWFLHAVMQSLDTALGAAGAMM